MSCARWNLGNKKSIQKIQVALFLLYVCVQSCKNNCISQWKDMGRNFPTPPEGWCRFGGAAGSGLCLGGLPTGWLWLQWWHWLYGAPWFATARNSGEKNLLRVGRDVIYIMTSKSWYSMKHSVSLHESTMFVTIPTGAPDFVRRGRRLPKPHVVNGPGWEVCPMVFCLWLCTVLLCDKGGLSSFIAIIYVIISERLQTYGCSSFKTSHSISEFPYPSPAVSDHFGAFLCDIFGRKICHSVT